MYINMKTSGAINRINLIKFLERLFYLLITYLFSLLYLTNPLMGYEHSFLNIDAHSKRVRA